MTTAFNKVSEWNIWCDNFLMAKTNAMTKEQTEAFFSIMLMQMDNRPIPAEVENEFFYSVASKRKDMMGLKISPYALLIICIMSSSVGDVVMYITAFTRYFNLAKHPIGVNEICTIFPMGFPTDAEKNRLWDEQKGYFLNQKFDNLVDRVSKEDF